MAIQGQELVNELMARTEGQFENITCVYALNSAQKTVVALADIDLLKNLSKVEGLAFKAGEKRVDLSVLTDVVNNQWLSFTQVTSPFYEYEIIGKQEANRLRRATYLTPSRNNPKAYIVGTNFYSICSDDPSPVSPAVAVNVEYISMPSDIVNNSTPIDLDSSLKEPLLFLAEAWLWRMDDELERSNEAYIKGMQFISSVGKKDMEKLAEDVQKEQAKEVLNRKG